MAAKDIYHDDVRSALLKEGWTITDDPFRLRWGKKDYYMAAVTAYADVIEQVLDYYTNIPYAHGDLTCEAICDRQRGRFALITLGWDDGERVHHPLAHIDIIDGKLWIQTDGTEHGIAPELVRAGIPKSDIVLAFRPPEVRKHTDYAVA